jgi:hypothetical protein
MPKKLTREELEKSAKELVFKAYNSFSNRAGLEAMWTRWDAAYNLEGDGTEADNTLSRLYPPETRRALQTIADFIIDVLFPPTSDWYRIMGVDDGADFSNAEIYQQISRLQNEKIMIRAKVIKAVHRWLKYGFVIVRTPYLYKDKYIIAEELQKSKFKTVIKNFFSGITKVWDSEAIPEKKKVPVYDNSDFQPKSPFNMLWNYNIPWDAQTILIEKIDNVTASHLRLQKKKKVYNDNVDKVITAISEQVNTGNSDNETSTGQKFPHMSTVTGLSGEFDDGSKKCRLIRAEVYFDLDQDGYDELCDIVIAITKESTSKNIDPEGEVILLEMNELQEFSYQFVPWDELEDMSLGMGVMQIADKDQKSLITFTNQTMDTITKILCATKMYDEELVAEGQNLNVWYNKTIKTKGNPNEVIAYDRPPNIINEAMAAVNMAKANIQNGTRASVSLQGLAARYDTTATEYTQQGSASSRGIMCQIKNFEDNILKIFLRRQYAYNLKYLTRDALIQILGKKAVEAMLKAGTSEEKTVNESIIGDYDFFPLGVTQTENKVIKGQQLINYLSVALKVEAIKPGTHDLGFISKKIWETIGDGDNRVLLPQITDPEMDPNDENVLLSQGAKVHINPKDDDKLHMSTHLPLQLIPEFDKNKIDHIKEHMVSAQNKIMQAQTRSALGPGNPKQATFQPKPPMPGNNGQVPGVVRPPVM